MMHLKMRNFDGVFLNSTSRWLTWFS